MIHRTKSKDKNLTKNINNYINIEDLMTHLKTYTTELSNLKNNNSDNKQ